MLSLSNIQLFCNPMDHHLPISSVRGISQARILDSVAFPPPGDLSDERTELHLPRLPHWQANSLPLYHLGSPD